MNLKGKAINFDYIMSYICNNPSLNTNIPILIQLDFQSLLACRFVNQSWKSFVDQPIFWLEQCIKKGKIFFKILCLTTYIA